VGKEPAVDGHRDQLALNREIGHQMTTQRADGAGTGAEIATTGGT
jgi:hypothetical protein